VCAGFENVARRELCPLSVTGYDLEEMELRDDEMVRRLVARDGPIRRGGFSHRATGECRYADLYPKGDCPWCAAVARREGATAG